MSILVLAEHDNAELKPATLNTVTAAKAIGGDIHVLVAGEGCGGVADAAAKIDGVSKVLAADAPEYGHGLAENVANLIVGMADGYSHILAPHTTSGKNILPRAAALLDLQQVSDITAVVSEDTFERLIYAGNGIATVQSGEAKKMVTVRTTSFDPAAEEGGSAAVEQVAPAGDARLTGFLRAEVSSSERPELTSAKIIISGGRGMQSGENFAMLERVADKLGAAVGASRAAVDAGFVPNDYQVS